MLNSEDAWNSLAFSLCPDEVLPSSFQVHVQGLSRFGSLSIACAKSMWSGSDTEREETIIVCKEAISERKDPLESIKDAPDVDIVYGSRQAGCQERPMRVEGHDGILPLGGSASKAEQYQSGFHKPKALSLHVHALLALR